MLYNSKNALFRKAAQNTAVSRHALGYTGVASSVHLRNCNEFSNISGSLLDLKWFLHPNPPHIDPLEVSQSFPDVPSGHRTFNMVVKLRNPNPNPVRLTVSMRDGGVEVGCTVQTINGTGRHFLTVTSDRDVKDMSITMQVCAHNKNAISRTGLEVISALFHANDPLTELANRAHSDKGTLFCVTESPHAYTLAYDALFSPRRNENISILEIGLNVGAHDRNRIDAMPSIDMWLAYFPKAEIFGLDIVDASGVKVPDRVTLGTADQSNPQEIADALAKLGNPTFDIIIDDGSHAPSHQRIAFETLASRLNPGGLYIIEDLGWQPWTETPTIPDLVEMARTGGHTSATYARFFDALDKFDENYAFLKPNDHQIFVAQSKSRLI